MELHISNTPEEVNKDLAEFIVSVCNDAIAARGRCSFVLSGGNSPKKLHGLLASSYADRIDWNAVDFFFGDERYVPFDSADNNGRMAYDTLFKPLGIVAEHIHYIDTSLEAALSAERYAESIKNYFDGQKPCFDFILLGLGDNVHTASLFPYTDILDEKAALVKAVFVHEIKAMRISLTAPLINQAREIAFLVYGSSKAAAVHAAIEGGWDYKKYPAQLISGNVHWFLDKEAASALRNNTSPGSRRSPL